MTPSTTPRYNTDKFNSQLIDEYVKVFTPIKNEKISLVEIGTTGGFLRWCQDFFTHPEIKLLGIDYSPPPIHPGDIFSFELCNQNDALKLQEIANGYGPFDIIIDDASHLYPETMNCFSIFWPVLSSNGYYVIEDWAVGFWKHDEFKHMIKVIPEIYYQMENWKIPEIKIVRKETPDRSIVFIQKG